MNNTLKNKAKFFALYLGQEVNCNDELGYHNELLDGCSIDLMQEKYVKDYLLLKPLSSIRDQYIIETKEFLVTHISDYLRSKGYALPWNGIYIEEQIEYGWIKLIENE